MRVVEKYIARLEPEWIFEWPEVGEFAGGRGRIIGVIFDCPVDDGPGPHREGHRVAVLFANPPDDGAPHPADPDMIGDNAGKRWTREGESLETLTLSPSIDCTRSDAHCWHGHVRGGMVSG